VGRASRIVTFQFQFNADLISLNAELDFFIMKIYYNFNTLFLIRTCIFNIWISFYNLFFNFKNRIFTIFFVYKAGIKLLYFIPMSEISLKMSFLFLSFWSAKTVKMLHFFGFISFTDCF
jgi:hypothetical protein